MDIKDERTGKGPNKSECLRVLSDWHDRTHTYLDAYESYVKASTGTLMSTKDNQNLRKQYMTMCTTVAAFSFCAAIIFHLLAFLLGGFIFNWKVGCVSSLHLATFALVLYIVAIGSFAGNFTTPGSYKGGGLQGGLDKGDGDCVALDGLDDTACDKAELAGSVTLPRTTKEKCEAAKASDTNYAGGGKIARPGSGKSCVYHPEQYTEGTWKEQKGKKKLSPGGSLLVTAMLMMTGAVILAGVQFRKDEEKKNAPQVEVVIAEGAPIVVATV